MPTNPPAYYTLDAAAFILGYFGGIFERAAFIVIGFAALFYVIFENDGMQSIGTPPQEMTASHYFLSNVASISLWAWAGAILSRALNNMKFLNHYTLLITQKRAEQRRRLTGKIWAFWVFLLLVFTGLIIYELVDIPYFARTLLGVGVVAVAWLVFYVLYRNETSYFSSSAPGVTTKDVVFTLVWIPALMIFVYGVVYLIAEFFAQEGFPPISTVGGNWFDKHWNFYTSLIFGAVYAAIAFGLQFLNMKTRVKPEKQMTTDEMKEWIQATAKAQPHTIGSKPYTPL